MTVRAAKTVQLGNDFKIIALSPLAKLTTFRVGGWAQWLALPKTLDQLQAALGWGRSEGLPVTLLGAGSNLLISDRGLPGLVICTRALRHSEFDPVTGRVTAAAGEPWSSLAWKAARYGLKGFEWTIGIPGTVGGAVVMNAGAHGSETADILVDTAIISPDGTLSIRQPADLGYRYRTSHLQGSDLIVATATFQLSAGHDPATIKAATATDLKQRRTTQPYHLPNCGSVFRNPRPYSAGHLIEQAGLKGYQIGQAQISTLHANFIVNLGNAKASDVLALIRHIQGVIYERHQIQLETEVKIMGHFSEAPGDQKISTSALPNG
ncbi:UDP-N-acetylmuramate dehydrogenase [soil metagenome]